MSSRVVSAMPRSRISAAAPSTMRCRVAAPLRVRFWTCGSIFYRPTYGLMSPNITRFAGRTALVTGSTGGLGVAVAHALAAEGAHVIVTGRSAERGDAVVADIRAKGGSARFVAADLAAGESAVRVLAASAGEVDILVNN